MLESWLGGIVSRFIESFRGCLTNGRTAEHYRRLPDYGDSEPDNYRGREHVES
jgi:hypothetical protein